MGIQPYHGAGQSWAQYNGPNTRMCRHSLGVVGGTITAGGRGRGAQTWPPGLPLSVPLLDDSCCTVFPGHLQHPDTQEGYKDDNSLLVRTPLQEVWG